MKTKRKPVAELVVVRGLARKIRRLVLKMKLEAENLVTINSRGGGFNCNNKPQIAKAPHPVLKDRR